MLGARPRKIDLTPVLTWFLLFLIAGPAQGQLPRSPVPSEELDLVRSVEPAAWLPPDPLLGFVARRRIRGFERNEPGER
jgi:hypothetical protein